MKRCARIVKMPAQINTVFQINPHYLRGFLSDKPGFSEKTTSADNVGFFRETYFI